MYRIEQRQGKYYVCHYKQRGPFIALNHFQGPFSRLRAEKVLNETIERASTRYHTKDYSHVEN
jgi:hypothetical protein